MSAVPQLRQSDFDRLLYRDTHLMMTITLLRPPYWGTRTVCCDTNSQDTIHAIVVVALRQRSVEDAVPMQTEHPSRHYSYYYLLLVNLRPQERVW